MDDARVLGIEVARAASGPAAFRPVNGQSGSASSVYLRRGRTARGGGGGTGGTGGTRRGFGLVPVGPVEAEFLHVPLYVEALVVVGSVAVALVQLGRLLLSPQYVYGVHAPANI